MTPLFRFGLTEALGRLRPRGITVLAGEDARDGATRFHFGPKARRGWHRLKLASASEPIGSLSFEAEERGACDRATHSLVHGRRWSGYVFLGRRARNVTLRVRPAASGPPKVEATLRRIRAVELIWKASRQRLLRPRLYRAWLAPDPVLFVCDAFPGSEGFRTPALDYDEWMRSRERRRERLLLDAVAPSGNEPPALSLLMPVSGPAGAAAVASVQGQTSRNWELCIVVLADAHPGSVRRLAKLARGDSRIRIVPSPDGSLAGALDRALALASSPFVARLDPTDRLSPRAVEICSAFLAAHPDTELLYTDEDRIDARGIRSAPYFKPDFSPELLRSCDYFGRLTVVRRERVCALGGWSDRADGVDDYDLALRIVETSEARRVRHVPAVLCHRSPAALRRGGAAAQASEAAAVVSQHLRRCGVAARAVPTPAGYVRVRYAVPEPSPTVSIIIPTRDKAEMLSTCVRSLVEKTRYASYDITIVDNGSTEAATAALLDELRSKHRVRVVEYPGPFNFSRLNNRAVAESTGDVLCFLNNDTEVIGSDWLAEMVGYALQPGVGCVGAKLYYEDGTIQHAGMVVGGPNVADHAFRGYPRAAAGYFGRLSVASNYSALTGACLLLRRSVFLEVGGFDEAVFPITFNDVDLCLKVMTRGYRNVWTPFAELYHRELTTRGPDNTPERIARLKREAELIAEKYGSIVAADPFYSPLMSVAPVNFNPCLAAS